jgi:hypothetical protein
MHARVVPQLARGRYRHRAHLHVNDLHGKRQRATAQPLRATRKSLPAFPGGTTLSRHEETTLSSNENQN